MAALLLGGFLSIMLRRSDRWLRRPLPIGGLLLAAASLEGLRETGHLVPGIVVATALLAVGGAVAHGLALGIIGRVTLAVPGMAVLLVGAGLINPGWSRAFIGVLVFLAAISLAPFERRCNAQRLNPGLLLLSLSVVGLYEAVPDPDLALVLVGASLPLLFLGWPVPAASLGGAGWAAFGLLGWEAGIGGSGRLSAVIGGVGCLGLFLAEPLATTLSRNRSSFLEMLPRGAFGGLILGLIQLAVVYVSSRVAGANPSHDPKIAVLIVTADLVFAALGLYWIAGHRHRDHARDRASPRPRNRGKAGGGRLQ